MIEKDLARGAKNPIEVKQMLEANCSGVERYGYHSSIETSLRENGSKTDNFVQVVESNIPAAFTLKVPIIKGGSVETLEIETFADIDGRDVSFTLLSPGANQTMEEIRNEVIDKELEGIRNLNLGITIIEA